MGPLAGLAHWHARFLLLETTVKPEKPHYVPRDRVVQLTSNADLTGHRIFSNRGAHRCAPPTTFIFTTPSETT